MNIVNLPQDIFPGRDIGTENVIFHEYSLPVGVFKGKSILHKNAISLVVSGEKTMHFTEKTVYARDTEFHFLSAGHCIVNMNISRERPFRSILIFFDTSIWTSFYAKYAGRMPNKNPVAATSYISFCKDAFTRNYIDSLQVLLRYGNQLSPAMKLVKLEELWLYLLEKNPQGLLSFEPGLQKSPDEMMIRKVVESNITSNISLLEMAFLCHMSVSTFKRRFIKLYGKSPNEWFLQERMKLAKELAAHSNRHTQQMAEVMANPNFPKN